MRRAASFNVELSWKSYIGSCPGSYPGKFVLEVVLENLSWKSFNVELSCKSWKGGASQGAMSWMDGPRELKTSIKENCKQYHITNLLCIMIELYVLCFAVDIS